MRLSVLGALVLLGCHHSDPPAPERTNHVRCIAATAGPWVDHVELQGVVEGPPDRHAVLAAQLAGRIVSVLVREGDVVAAGAMVAEIEHGPLEDALHQTESQVTQAEVALRNAELVRDRARHLVETGVGAQQALDDANARYETAAAARSAARAAASSSQRIVRRSSVVAPVAGVVLHVFRRSGELVDGTSTTPILEIADPAALELTATVGAADVGKLARGQAATVRFAVLGGTAIAGTVRAVAPAVDPMTGLGLARLSLVASSAQVPFGVLGVASVTTGTRPDVVSVPLTAIRTGPEGTPEALACAGDKVKALRIRAGSRSSERIEISEGIAVGTRVVDDAALGLEDGATIEVAP